MSDIAWITEASEDARRAFGQTLLDSLRPAIIDTAMISDPEMVQHNGIITRADIVETAIAWVLREQLKLQDELVTAPSGLGEKDKKQETQHAWCVSTTHMTFEDNLLLSKGTDVVDYYKGKHGFFVLVDVEVGENGAVLEGLSAEFNDVMKQAYQQGFQYVHFDADGPEVEGLRAFDW
jgi:hypothetical protein